MDGTGTLMTVEAAIEAINDVPSNSSTEFSDYVDYAVVLDQILQQSHFAESDKLDLLASLEKVLAQNEALVEAIGWDVPGFLLPFLGSKNTYSAAKHILLTSVARHANPKEVFIKCVEHIQAIKNDYLNSLYDEGNETDSGDEGPGETRFETLLHQFTAICSLIEAVRERINVRRRSNFWREYLHALLSCAPMLLNLQSGIVNELNPLTCLFPQGIPNSESGDRTDTEDLQLQTFIMKSYLTYLVMCLSGSNEFAQWLSNATADWKPITATKRDIAESQVVLQFQAAMEDLNLLENDLLLDVSNPQDNDADRDSDEAEEDQEAEVAFKSLCQPGAIYLLAIKMIADKNGGRLIPGLDLKMHVSLTQELFSHYAVPDDTLLSPYITLGVYILQASPSQIDTTEIERFRDYIQLYSDVILSIADEELRLTAWKFVSKLISLLPEEEALSFLIEATSYLKDRSGKNDSLRAAFIGNFKDRVASAQKDSVFWVENLKPQLDVLFAPIGDEDVELFYSSNMQLLNFYLLLLLKYGSQQGIFQSPAAIKATQSLWIEPMSKDLEHFMDRLKEKKSDGMMLQLTEMEISMMKHVIDQITATASTLTTPS